MFGSYLSESFTNIQTMVVMALRFFVSLLVLLVSVFDFIVDLLDLYLFYCCLFYLVSYITFPCFIFTWFRGLNDGCVGIFVASKGYVYNNGFHDCCTINWRILNVVLFLCIINLKLFYFNILFPGFYLPNILFVMFLVVNWVVDWNVQKIRLFNSTFLVPKYSFLNLSMLYVFIVDPDVDWNMFIFVLLLLLLLLDWLLISGKNVSSCLSWRGNQSILLLLLILVPKCPIWDSSMKS